MVLEIHMKLWVKELDFLEKIFFLSHKIGKWTKNGSKTRFFEFIGKFGHLMNLFSNENLFYLLCLYTNAIFGKIFVLEIWAKMSSANQSARFLIDHISRTNAWNNMIFCMLRQISINKKFMKKFCGGQDQKWAWPFSSRDPKIKEFMNWASFLHADCDGIIFG